MENAAKMKADRTSVHEGANTVDYIKDLFATRSNGLLGQGIHSGVGAAISRTALRSLPAPLNMVAPMVIEKLVIRHGVPLGTNLLLNGLRWVKKVTDEKPGETGK